MPRIATNPEKPFRRVYVDYLIKGGARISWEVHPCLQDPLPWLFQLQTNTNSDEPDNWVNVGDPVLNNFFKIDPTQRLFGKEHRLAYRVALTTNSGSYVSDLATIFGNLNLRQWLLAEAIIRRAKLTRNNLPKPQGYLFKRKLYGTICTCVDELTGLTTDPDCSLCSGTGKVDGYWNNVPISLYDITPEARESKLDDQLVRGTVNDATERGGVFIGFPFINPKDIWVLSGSDKRYNIKQIKHLSEINGVPIVTQVNMSLLPFTDPVYQLEIDDG